MEERTARYARLLKQYITESAGQMVREPAGLLTEPYIVPCTPDSPYYSTTLWDWDSWLTGIALGQAEADTGRPGLFERYEQGSVLNFLKLCSPEGEIPICVTEDSVMTRFRDGRECGLTNMHKPVLAQQAAAIVQRKTSRSSSAENTAPGGMTTESTSAGSAASWSMTAESTAAGGAVPGSMTAESTAAGGAAPWSMTSESTVAESTAPGGMTAGCTASGSTPAGWIAPYMDSLARFIDAYLDRHREKETGLLYWQDDFAVGVDNDPSVFYRPKKSCGSIYLNSLMYRELLACGYLYEQLGDMQEANRRRLQASQLAEAVNRWCFDERDGMYYSVDFALNQVDPEDWLHAGAPRDYPCLLQRIDSWSGFLPLWAGIASAEQAARVAARVTDERTFACRYGIRTLSRLEKTYDLRASNNPSNWRGPVWGVSNYLVFSGLVKYGYEEEAAKLALQTTELFGRDLEANGCLHEYYHPDNGEPIITHHFQNWNFLVLNMIAWLEKRRFVDTF